MKLRAVISLLLSLMIALSLPVQVFAEEKSPVYVGEVMVGMGETAEAAKKALTDAGYTVLDRNLNEGAGSTLKTEKFVYLGYRTTTDVNEAITDLAVMNMNGGYSFSDYAVLMEKYRDSQIKPFIDNFIATIKEYRKNYNSADGANKDKAEFAHAILNRIVEEDTGTPMGDLLLTPSKEERGLTSGQYKALSAAEKKKTADLTTTLMQGNSQIILLIEQVLAMAADTNETTWLERLSKLGPDGLEKQYAAAGKRPADANREMASLYGDTARIILENWTDLRAELLDYELMRGSDTEETAFDEDALAGVYGDAEPKSYDVKNPVGAMERVNDRLEAGLEMAEEVENSRIAAIYDTLRETPYGEGTMFDFFTKPYAEVSGENVSALYPLVSTLSAGQVAAIEFLPLATLLRIGVMNGEAYEAIGSDNSDIMEIFDTIDTVSVYYNVNREIFKDCTALTSEALRKNAGGAFSFTDPITELGGLSALTALFWTADAVALTATLYNVVRSRSYTDLASRLTSLCEKVKNHYKIFADPGLNIIIGVDPQDSSKLIMASVEANNKGGFTIGTKFTAYDIQSDMDLADQFGSFDHMKGVLDDKSSQAMGRAAKFKNAAVISGVAFAVLTVISVALTVYDLYRFYNVNYTPIPKYIVDEADITKLDRDGNKIVVRNDASYYTAAMTNRSEKHEQYKALNDYADLNGDVGKEWLALYYCRNINAEPILADSFKIVTGTASMPEGYNKGIHMFGSNAAANLTDSRYTYNYKLNGLYVYYLTETAAPSQAASTFSGGALALVGAGGAVIGAALGAIAALMIKRKKKAAPAEA